MPVGIKRPFGVKCLMVNMSDGVRCLMVFMVCMVFMVFMVVNA